MFNNYKDTVMLGMDEIGGLNGSSVEKSAEN